MMHAGSNGQAMVPALRSIAIIVLTGMAVQAAAPPDRLLHLRLRAARAEADEQFDDALELYLQVYLAGARGDDVRTRIHDNFRRAAQLQRLSDPEHIRLGEELSPADALNLFAETLDKLSTHYADRDRARPSRLFAMGIEEIGRALANRKFRSRFLPDASDEAINRFSRMLAADWAARAPQSVREARTALQELVKIARRELGTERTTPLILEAISGACGGLDEATAFLPRGAGREPAAQATVPRAELIDPVGGVGLIQIARFTEATPLEFEQAHSRLQREGMRALVLDLRGNSGGSLAAAIRLAGRFVPSGLLALTDGQLAEFHDRTFTSSEGAAAITVPLIVLVDGGTMSAAEVLASALAERGRATLIGTPTFGKGTVQSPVPLADAESGRLVVTIARVFSASGAALQGRGVTPHIVEQQPTLQLQLAVQRAAEIAGGM